MHFYRPTSSRFSCKCLMILTQGYKFFVHGPSTLATPHGQSASAQADALDALIQTKLRVAEEDERDPGLPPPPKVPLDPRSAVAPAASAWARRTRRV